MIELPPVPSGSAALTDKEGRATRPLQSFLNAIRAAFATAIDSLLPIHLTDANTVEQYNGTTAQAWRLYNTYTDASNYERLGVSWASSVLSINTQAAGTGTQRALVLQGAGGIAGVGMTRAPVPFAVLGTTGNPAISIENTAGGAPKRLKFGFDTSSGNGYGWIQYSAEGVAHTALVLNNSGGNLGVGVTAPTGAVHIKAGSATASTAPLKFTSGTVNTTAEAGAVEYDGANYWGTSAGPSRYPFPRTIFTATADKTVGGTNTETTLFGTGVGTLTLPANFFVAGRTIRAQLSGYVSDTGSPTMQVRIKLGSTVIATALSGALITSTTRPYIVEALLTCRTTGASGAFMAQISQRYASSGEGTYSMTTATVAVNTAASQVLDVMLTWGTSDALNTATITNAVVEVLN